MIVTIIGVRLLHSLRFLLVVSLLALPWWTPSRCLGQDKSPQTEEERQPRQDLNEGVQAFKNGQYQEAERYFAHAKQFYPKLLNAVCISRRLMPRSTSRVRRAKKTFAWGTPRP